jgi:hypothetical protein
MVLGYETSPPGGAGLYTGAARPTISEYDSRLRWFIKTSQWLGLIGRKIRRRREAAAAVFFENGEKVLPCR